MRKIKSAQIAIMSRHNSYASCMRWVMIYWQATIQEPDCRDYNLSTFLRQVNSLIHRACDNASSSPLRYCDIRLSHDELSQEILIMSNQICLIKIYYQLENEE
ncbi:MAG: hypothetical protein SNH18_10400 [Rikenellaceae bacterium]